MVDEIGALLISAGIALALWGWWIFTERLPKQSMEVNYLAPQKRKTLSLTQMKRVIDAQGVDY